MTDMESKNSKNRKKIKESQDEILKLSKKLLTKADEQKLAELSLQMKEFATMKDLKELYSKITP